jgi:adenylate kinase
MRLGALVPDSTVWEMVRERFACLQCGGEFILDGFPRTLGQAECMKQLMDGEGLTLAAVVNHQLPARGMVTRLGGHRTCDQCQAIFHLTERPRKTAGRCDRCEGRLFQKEDDRPESIEIRLKVYGQTTAPLIAFYQNLGLLVEVAAIGISRRDLPGNAFGAEDPGIRHNLVR